MSLSIEDRLREFLASAPRSIHIIQTLEISHSAMTQTYYLSREPYEFEITTESGVRTVQPVNLVIKLAGDEGHLDQNFDIRISTVDIEDEFREQLDLIPIDTLEKIRCVYREYLSDDLTDMVAGPVVLQVETIICEIGVAAISAVYPRYNSTRTGESYVPRDVPMLRRFL
jgi:hypothetical protein